MYLLGWRGILPLGCLLRPAAVSIGVLSKENFGWGGEDGTLEIGIVPLDWEE